jgi:hypothetical protein
VPGPPAGIPVHGTIPWAVGGGAWRRQPFGPSPGTCPGFRRWGFQPMAQCGADGPGFAQYDDVAAGGVKTVPGAATPSPGCQERRRAASPTSCGCIRTAPVERHAAMGLRRCRRRLDGVPSPGCAAPAGWSQRSSAGARVRGLRMAACRSPTAARRAAAADGNRLCRAFAPVARGTSAARLSGWTAIGCTQAATPTGAACGGARRVLNE